MFVWIWMCVIFLTALCLFIFASVIMVGSAALDWSILYSKSKMHLTANLKTKPVFDKCIMTWVLSVLVDLELLGTVLFSISCQTAAWVTSMHRLKQWSWTSILVRRCTNNSVWGIETLSVPLCHRAIHFQSIGIFLHQLVMALLPSVLWCCWLGSRIGIRPVKTEWCCAGVVICLERGADLHMVQLMPLPL